MDAIKQGHKGASGELSAAVWLLEQGYEVFRNVSASGPIDLVAVRLGDEAQYVTLDRREVLFFDVKSRSNGSGAPLTDDQITLGVIGLHHNRETGEIKQVEAQSLSERQFNRDRRLCRRLREVSPRSPSYSETVARLKAKVA